MYDCRPVIGRRSPGRVIVPSHGGQELVFVLHCPLVEDGHGVEDPPGHPGVSGWSFLEEREHGGDVLAALEVKAREIRWGDLADNWTDYQVD